MVLNKIDFCCRKHNYDESKSIKVFFLRRWFERGKIKFEKKGNFLMNNEKTTYTKRNTSNFIKKIESGITRQKIC